MRGGTPRPGERIWVVGPSGAGKSTLARELARRLELPHHELDGLFWLPGWRRRAEDDFTAAVERIAGTPRWIIDGQYECVHPVLTQAADTVIWVDPGPRVTAVRVVRRTLVRWLRRERLWNGNRQSLSNAVTLFVWAWRTYPAVRYRNGKLLRGLAGRGVRHFVVRTPHDLRQVLSAAGPPGERSAAPVAGPDRAAAVPRKGGRREHGDFGATGRLPGGR